MNLNKNKKINQNTMFIAILISFLSQVYLQIDIPDFRVSLGIILLPLCYYINEDMQILTIGILSSVFVYLMRILMYVVSTDFLFINVLYGVTRFSPEMFFYVIYFALFNCIVSCNRFKNNKNINFILAVCIICDFAANISEVIIRNIISLNTVTAKQIVGLASFALLRSLLIWVILNVINRYTMFLSKKEHEDRYKKLLYTTSELKTELYWMEKSMHKIEDVMSKSYDLYYNINKENKNWKESALNIAKDIHEIKKENMLVLRGLEEILIDKLDDEGMYVSDIFDILDNSLKSYMTNIGKNIKLNFKFKENININKHYYLMSVLRNLIMNSIDSIDTKGEIVTEEYCCKIKGIDYYVFKVKDNGSGIEEENIQHIFSPGFSTKINYTTGSVNRGLGLSIVKEIIENTFKGYIDVNIENGTEFVLHIPKNELEAV